MPEETKEAIISPFTPIMITKEYLDKIRKELNASSLMIIASNDSEHIKCTPGKCQGHDIEVNGMGFNQGQILGILNKLAGDLGFHLEENDNVTTAD
jgi:hypothetical protein